MGLTIHLPSKATADALVFDAHGSARAVGWTFHRDRPDWIAAKTEAGSAEKSVDQDPTAAFAIPAQSVLSLIHRTSTRHISNQALAGVGLIPNTWQFLFQAMIEAESGYNPKALSPKGAYGLGQLMPSTAKNLGVDSRDVAQNLDGAARYLLAQLATFKDIDLALAAYNAGPHRVVQYSGVPPFAETKAYIARIHRIRARLSGSTPLPLQQQTARATPARPPLIIDLE